MIDVYVGSAPKYAEVEPIMAQCIADQASEPVSIQFMRAGENDLRPSGCTGFTMYRYAVPRLADRKGFAIYLDVDMFVLGDIAELWEYRYKGAWSCLKDGSTEVMVIDCATGSTPHPKNVHQYQKGQIPVNLRPCIPLNWNHEDELHADTKLLHFTDLSRQPFFTDTHPLRGFWDELKSAYA